MKIKRDTSFRDWVVDELSRLPLLICKPMFGGYGLYSDGVFFGLIAEGRLYFKTSEQTQIDYEAQGAQRFEYAPGKVMKRYFEVPLEVLEDHDMLLSWARVAVGVSRENP